MSGEVKTFTQEEVDEIVKGRLAKEQKKFDSEKKELERKHGETLEEYEERVKNANLTAEEKYQKELDKIKTQLSEKDTELSTIKKNEIKKATLSKHKLPEKFLNRVSGETEEEIEASVKELGETIGEFIKGQASGIPSILDGGSGGKETLSVRLETAKKKAEETGSVEDRANYQALVLESENNDNNGGGQ